MSGVRVLIASIALAACKSGATESAASSAAMQDGGTPVQVVALPPRWNAEHQEFPRSCDAAVSRLLGVMDADLRARMLATPKEALPSLQDSLGASVANAFGLWEDNPQLLVSCASSRPGTSADATAVSQLIIERAWDRLQTSVARDD